MSKNYTNNNAKNHTKNVEHVTVSEDDDGQRLDRWLKSYAPSIPYGLAQKLIRKGQLRVDGKRAKADTRLVAGQDIRIPPIDSKPQRSDKKSPLSAADKAFIKSLIIHDDGDIIALNKPSGLAVQGGTNMTRHVDGLLEALLNEEGVKPRLVHRLDKDTSGVLLLARSAKVAKQMGAMFKGKDIKKIYWALVAPTPELSNGAINAPLLKAGGGNKERMVVDEEEGKRALTEYSVVESALDKAAFVAFWPRTGRTHQIRVHAELIGCPVLGDHKYRGKKRGAEHAGPKQHGSGHDEVIGVDGLKGVECANRLHLHAQRISCKHPTKKGMLDIVAPLPPELVKSWKTFGFDSKYKQDPFENIDP